MTHSPCIYGEVPQGPRHSPGNPCNPRGQALLPVEWLGKAVPPQSFRVYREYEVPARRVLGLDSAGNPCYCSYDYRLIALRSDDDEELYSAISYEESLKAWRLTDGRWLVHRRLAPFGEEGEQVSGFSLDERMPR
jgi:hypothetical protein